MRYIGFKNGKQEFYYGGKVKKIDSRYIILANDYITNRSPITWSVARHVYDDSGKKIFNTIFFKRVKKGDLDNYRKIQGLEFKVKEQDEIIEQQQSDIVKLKRYIKMLQKTMRG